MLAILKLLQSLVKTLHSDGTPGQIAAGIALGAALGLTPILNVHNLVVFVFLGVLNVSFASAMLSWAIFVPFGFMFDPLFDRLGHWLLLGVPTLRPMWTAMDNVPGLALTNFNNTVVLGSFMAWLVLLVPLYFAARVGVVRYRETLGKRLMESRFYKLMQATKVLDLYHFFRG